MRHFVCVSALTDPVAADADNMLFMMKTILMMVTFVLLLLLPLPLVQVLVLVHMQGTETAWSPSLVFVTIWTLLERSWNFLGMVMHNYTYNYL